MPAARKIIAVIEDDESVRNALARQLQAAGYRYELFSSAESFLSVAGVSRAACVLSDIHLGGMSGLELATHPLITGLKMPVLLMSGTIDPSVEEPARELSAAFLRKPIGPGKLLEAIVDTVGPPIVEGE